MRKDKDSPNIQALIFCYTSFMPNNTPRNLILIHTHDSEIRSAVPFGDDLFGALQAAELIVDDFSMDEASNSEFDWWNSDEVGYNVCIWNTATQTILSKD